MARECPTRARKKSIAAELFQRFSTLCAGAETPCLSLPLLPLRPTLPRCSVLGAGRVTRPPGHSFRRFRLTDPPTRPPGLPAVQSEAVPGETDNAERIPTDFLRVGVTVVMCPTCEPKYQNVHSTLGVYIDDDTSAYTASHESPTWRWARPAS